jgi:hypothetical protein
MPAYFFFVSFVPLWFPKKRSAVHAVNTCFWPLAKCSKWPKTASGHVNIRMLS